MFYVCEQFTAQSLRLKIDQRVNRMPIVSKINQAILKAAHDLDHDVKFDSDTFPELLVRDNVTNLINLHKTQTLLISLTRSFSSRGFKTSYELPYVSNQLAKDTAAPAHFTVSW